MYGSICLCVFYAPEIGAMARYFPVSSWKIFGDPLEFGAPHWTNPAFYTYTHVHMHIHRHE